MNNNVIRQALRFLILTEDYIPKENRHDALDELVRLERAEVVNAPSVAGEQMRSFREYRKHNDRIPTIKMIRSVLDVGLTEALIIVKGIESHDDIK